MATGQTPPTRKVHLRVVAEVDEQFWSDEFGVDVEEVSDDVRSYVQTTLQDSYPGQHLGVKFSVIG